MWNIENVQFVCLKQAREEKETEIEDSPVWERIKLKLYFDLLTYFTSEVNTHTHTHTLDIR